MKRSYIYPLLIIGVSVLFYYLEKQLDNSNTTITKTTDSSFFYLPSSTTDAITIHSNYALSYSEKHEQPEWVAYELKKEHLTKNEFKRPYFEIDPKIRTNSADWRNYKKSGYDKGHLCPAGDRRFTYDAFKETFLTSNISPQNHDFNAGIWNRLEQKVRYWTHRYDQLYVITGGVLEEQLPTIGYEAVSIPNYFYKIILDNHATNPKIIAFLIPHKESSKPLSDFIVPVDHLEKITGIDFFPALEDSIEKRLEVTASHSGWKM